MTKLAARDRAILLVGSFGPLGYMPASGTVTVGVLGIPLFWLAQQWPVWVIPVASVVVCAFSVWIHQVGDRILNEKDSRKLVWDEIAGYMIAIAFLPFTWQIAIIAFLIERCIDIAKVPPARGIERNWPGGWGVVGDDVVAGLYTCGIMHALIRFVPHWMGL